MNMIRLKMLRKEKKFTQIKMQMLTGIDQSDYSKMERGLKSPTMENLIQFALIFNTSIDFIVGITEDRRPHPRNKAAVEIQEKFL